VIEQEDVPWQKIILQEGIAAESVTAPRFVQSLATFQNFQNSKTKSCKTDTQITPNSKP